MKVLDIFSWLPAKEISLEKLEEIFQTYYAGIYRGEYTVSLETPCNIEKNMLECREEIMEEGKRTGYVLKGNRIIALIGYKE